MFCSQVHIIIISSAHATDKLTSKPHFTSTYHSTMSNLDVARRRNFGCCRGFSFLFIRFDATITTSSSNSIVTGKQTNQIPGFNKNVLICRNLLLNWVLKNYFDIVLDVRRSKIRTGLFSRNNLKPKHIKKTSSCSRNPLSQELSDIYSSRIIFSHTHKHTSSSSSYRRGELRTPYMPLRITHDHISLLIEFCTMIGFVGKSQQNTYTYTFNIFFFCIIVFHRAVFSRIAYSIHLV